MIALGYSDINALSVCSEAEEKAAAEKERIEREQAEQAKLEEEKFVHFVPSFLFELFIWWNFFFCSKEEEEKAGPGRKRSGQKIRGTQRGQ